MTEQATGKAIEIIKTAISMAEDAGTVEVTEALNPLLEMLHRAKCRKSLEINGMTGYCLPSCCPQHKECSKENGFNEQGRPVRFDSTVQSHLRDHCLNWYGGTGIQPKVISNIQQGTSNKQIKEKAS